MSVRKALSFAFLDRYASLIIGIGASMALARLLTPADVAAFSIAAVLIGFLSAVRDLGAGQYLVREQELNPERIRAVWTVQLGLGLLIAAVVAAAGPAVAAIYREPRMREIMLVLAAGFLVNPFGALTHAWLTRELRYEPIALTRFAGTVAGAVVSIVLAWQGHGPMSLALGSFASTVISAALLLPMRPRSFPWLPGVRGLDRVASFGGALTATTLLRTLWLGAPELLLGRLQSLTAAGLYSRASGLVALFHSLVTNSIHGVALAWFSRETRQGGDASQPFIKASAYVAAVGWAFCLFIALLAHPIVLALFGPQWVGAIDLARILAAAMAFGVPATLCFAALVAVGAVIRVLKVTAISTAMSVALALPGALLGLLWIGLAQVLASACSAALFMRLTQSELGFQWAALRSALIKSGWVALCSGLAPAAAVLVFGIDSEAVVAPLVFGAVGCAAGFFVGVFATGHPMRDEFIRLWGQVNALRRA